MSTVVVVQKNGVACLAADTLTHHGPTKQTPKYVVNSAKVVKIGGTFIGTVGHASADLILLNYFSRARPVPSFANPAQIFEVFRRLQQRLKDDYFVNPVDNENDPYESMRMDCLLANPFGIFGVHDLRSVNQYTRF